jgi:hypothetical protein
MSNDLSRPFRKPEQREAEQACIARLEALIQALILMKETGPKSAAWHRARVRTLWRLQHQVAELQSMSSTRSGSHGTDIQ